MDDKSPIKNIKKNPEELRKIWIKIRVTKEERVQMQNRIPENVSLSDYVRGEIFKLPVSGWSPVKNDIAPEVLETVRNLSNLFIELNRIGENVNQIARALNTLAKSDTTIPRGQYLQELNAISKNISGLRKIAEHMKDRI